MKTKNKIIISAIGLTLTLFISSFFIGNTKISQRTISDKVKDLIQNKGKFSEYANAGKLNNLYIHKLSVPKNTIHMHDSTIENFTWDYFCMDKLRYTNMILKDGEIIGGSMNYNTLENVTFINLKFSNFNWNDTIFKNVKFINCEFTEVSFWDAKVSEFEFENCNLNNLFVSAPSHHLKFLNTTMPDAEFYQQNDNGLSYAEVIGGDAVTLCIENGNWEPIILKDIKKLKFSFLGDNCNQIDINAIEIDVAVSSNIQNLSINGKKLNSFYSRDSAIDKFILGRFESGYIMSMHNSKINNLTLIDSTIDHLSFRECTFNSLYLFRNNFGIFSLPNTTVDYFNINNNTISRELDIPDFKVGHLLSDSNKVSPGIQYNYTNAFAEKVTTAKEGDKYYLQKENQAGIDCYNVF